ncbi:glycosyltransferase family 2 protein [Vibrio sonorensis]|uniref:glycosyltransferase family 2 protein n=1 Tax=Vibrio sonorensis TaxID=1004316 RepID=UPI0008D97620|nr:glycosyltransferase family 2 protein [Vibrio sonorensis]
MINIVIPMAGAGSRFAKEGYKDPKPLIPIDGEPMIKLVISNLTPSQEHKFIFICQQKHVEEYGLKSLLSEWSPNCEIVEIDGLTEGAACTVLKAEKFIDNDAPLMIANSDQYVDVSIDEYLSTMQSQSLDGLIMTMKADDPKWSFVGLSDDALVTRVVEKEVISDEATVGIYNFARGADFVAAAKDMIDKKLMVNGEYYVAPAYNQKLSDTWKVGIFNIGSEASGMYGLGIPSDLELFKSLPVCQQALLRCVK